jgi:hypothetical protein
MMRTRAEIHTIAQGIVNQMASDILAEFPTVCKAVDRLSRATWGEALDDLTSEVEEILLNKFDSRD